VRLILNYRYIYYTLKAGYLYFLVFTVITIGFYVLYSLTLVDFAATYKFALSGLKVAMIAILIPYITTSIQSFYRDIKDSEPSDYVKVAKYYRSELITTLGITILVSISLVSDMIFLTTCSNIFWYLSLSTITSSVIFMIILSIYISLKIIGEIETLRKAGKKLTKANNPKSPD